MNKFAIYIGRFQPFHNAHLESVRFALAQAERVIVVIGSDNQAPDIKNPWSTAARIEMIESCFTQDELSRIDFVPVEDHLYNDNMWIAQVQRCVNALVGRTKDVILVGRKKDASSFYLKLFPQWTYVDSGLMLAVSATQVRDMMFTLDTLTMRHLLPPSVYDHVLEFMKTDQFSRLHDEYHYLQDYRAEWKYAPFPPTFNTVDAVVFCSGHVLLVRRRGTPGRGLLALPGGFLNQSELIVDGCMRELKEETGIKVHKTELMKHIVDQRVFDHPDRSLRGRTITHAFCIDLGHGELPIVKGMDDADKAFWLSFDDIYARKAEFFEDHFHMLSSFISRAGRKF